MKYYFHCPRCSNNEEFIKPEIQEPEFGLALLANGSLNSVLIYTDHKKRRVQCEVCGLIFQRPPLPTSPVAQFARWIVGLMVVLICTALLAVGIPGLGESVPPIPGIAPLEDMVVAQPRIVTYFIALLIGLIAGSCFFASWLSNTRYRKQFSKITRMEPVPQDKSASRRVAV